MDLFKLMPEGTNLFTVFAAFLLTLVAHTLARILSKRISGLPMVITALVLVLLFLFIFNCKMQHSDFQKLINVIAECFILSNLNYKIIVNWWKKKANK